MHCDSELSEESDSCSETLHRVYPERANEMLRAVCPERAIEMLRGVYPEPRSEILHFVQDDSGRIQDDSEGLSMPVEGFRVTTTKRGAM